MSGTPVLALNGISKRFGAVRALSDASLEVRPGEVVALVGDNGAGKSTMIKVIAGVNPADSGEVRFNGTPGQHRQAERCHGPWHRDRLPGSRALRQPGRGREPLPRAGGHSRDRAR